MSKHVTETTKIRRRVLTEVAKLALNNELLEKVDELPEILVNQHEQRYRCCEYKEKAIYAERIKLGMGLPLSPEYHKKPLGTLAQTALDNPECPENQVYVIDIACENCPINKFMVTNACQNCLAHPCQTACPKNAISVVANQAFIDQSSCVECGLCKKACPYGAILEIHRPCERSCHLKAIKSGADRKATIEQDKCVDCGACTQGCPFGAISHRSQIVKVINYIKSEDPVIALLAPSFVGQWGQKDNPQPIYEGLRRLGFRDIREVALGADMISIIESQEFIETVPSQRKFMTTSCCPAFVANIRKYYPEIAKENMSSAVSPMVAIAKAIKQEIPNAKLVFVGPCIAKKREGQESQVIDAVLTFEELTAMFVAAGINLADIEISHDRPDESSETGQNFAFSGGVTKAVEAALSAYEDIDFKPLKAEGLDECNAALQAFRKGQQNGNFLEGMACAGGCLGGPGTLLDNKFTKRFLQTHSKESLAKSAGENKTAVELVAKNEHEMHRVSH